VDDEGDEEFRDALCVQDELLCKNDMSKMDISFSESA